MQIHEAIAAIMGEVGSIKKGKYNQGQGYRFRGIDDVYLAVHDLFAKHGVFSVPTILEERTEERTTKSGSALIYRVLKIRYDFFARDGSSISATVIGEGMDSGDKASNKAMSVAHKYAILQLFSIPTEDTIDPEVDSPEVTPKADPKIALIKAKIWDIGGDTEGRESLRGYLAKKWGSNLDAVLEELEDIERKTKGETDEKTLI